MNQSIKPRALVTGASRGIGAAIALQLAQEGYHILLNFFTNFEKAEQVLDQIIQNGGSGELLPFDVSQANQVHEKFKWIANQSGPLKILVNNAGINQDALLIRLKNEDLDQILNINLKGAIYCSRAAIPLMLKEGGSMIQISSVIGEHGNAGQSAYSASKAGLIGFSKSLAQELGSRQIRVNVVSSGYIVTDMTAKLTNEQKQAILQKTSLKKFGKPEDVAFLVSFLASPKSQYITGQVIGIHGGMHA